MKIATLGLIVQNDKVLLGEKKKGKFAEGTLNGPGGKTEGEETLEECLVRETEEEWGLRLVRDDLVQVARIVFYFDGKADFEVHVFRAERFEGLLCETEESYCPVWYPVTNLPLSRMLEADREWMQKAISGERFSARAYYKEQAKGFERIEFFSPDF